MSAVRDLTMSASGWTAGRARALLVVVTLAFLLPSPVFTLIGYDGGAQGHPLVVVPLATTIGVIHLRHALATGGRPAGWPATFSALLILVYVPMIWWTFNWAAMQWFVIASAAIVLRPRQALVVAMAPILGMTAVSWALVSAELGPLAPENLYVAVYWIAGLVLGGTALYGSAQLVGVVDELDATREELAEAAVGRERLRLSRDLHDLLGQSLSAVSLKGDLALALLRQDPQAARAEIESLTEVARDALRGIRTVTRDEHDLTLATECDGAAALLAAAGIEARVEVDLLALPPAIDVLLAWAVREGVTNVLRHSEARTCSIHAAHHGTSARLEIVNDGPRPGAGDGTGLAGLAERARALGGSVSSTCTGGEFRLVVEVPEESP